MSSSFLTRRLFPTLMALALMTGIAHASTSSSGAHTLDKQLRASHAWLSEPGHQDHFGNNRFMPLPAGTFDAASNVYVGEEDVTLRPNEGFFLPLFYWFGEQYADGSADDPDFPSPADFLGSNVLLTLDGTPILDSADGLDDSYVDTTYYPTPLAYPAPTSYDSVATYFVKGLSTQHGPLSPGTHELHLIITNPFVQALAGFSGWDNTWHIVVEK